MSTFLTAAHHRVTVFFYWPIKNLESTMNNVPVNKTHHEYIRMCVYIYIYIPSSVLISTLYLIGELMDEKCTLLKHKIYSNVQC